MYEYEKFLIQNKLLIFFIFLSILSCRDKKEDIEFNKKITNLIILNEKDKVLKLVDSAIITDKKEFILSKQLLKNGTSIKANIEVSIGG